MILARIVTNQNRNELEMNQTKTVEQLYVGYGHFSFYRAARSVLLKPLVHVFWDSIAFLHVPKSRWLDHFIKTACAFKPDESRPKLHYIGQHVGAKIFPKRINIMHFAWVHLTTQSIGSIDVNKSITWYWLFSNFLVRNHGLGKNHIYNIGWLRKL